MLILKSSTNTNNGGENPASLEGKNEMNGGKLKMYEKEYEIYFNSLKEGEEVLSLKEYIEAMGWVTEEKEEKN
ncbi:MULTISPECIES: hypothetical protein [Enterobacteriaceae]|uniref:hypothetical protein n=1 Tax=Enterobacteriaceae TaxID=543 RepID=UPI001934276E|nr:hypothetical protein [Klebsiella pneumoniae]EFU0737742.1 hypothetical protein [Escherichia coli]EGH0619945.1 hypothetical protein [Escherichia coli]EHC1971676.1 hypothetical protein [Escherichia coli]EHE8248281.1 hypothetical protein [Escherichia coli]EJZ6203282.1 hypothetical protein [Escherichia coli]